MVCFIWHSFLLIGVVYLFACLFVTNCNHQELAKIVKSLVTEEDEESEKEDDDSNDTAEEEGATKEDKTDA